MPKERPSYRLPHTVEPRRYQLEVVPDLNQGTFAGTMSVTIDVLEPVREMVLNAVNLQVADVMLTGPEGKSMSGSVSYRTDDEQVALAWPEEAVSGGWTLSLRFDGVFAQDLRGFYLTSVTGADGNPVVIASTQCEATDARRIFPCWDEPEFKAVFAVTLVVDPHLTALSNAREVSSMFDEQGRRHVTFADTMPMSTYLVALVVGPLELTPPVLVGTVPVRVAAHAGVGRLTAMAETAAVDTLRFFEEYFGIPYPGDKIDHVAIPEFAAGAMENLGCVTYREEQLLIDPERSSPVEQMNVVETIAHETAHMWFGDLVTMRWWNGIWLNEAFATFMQLLATDALHPEWDVWTTFSHGRAYALGIDALASTRAIEYPVGPPVEAWGMFDVLTYEKGASILRMLEQYLGPEVFKQGIREYLERHRYGNTETGDLWDALEGVSGQPVRAVMDSWVFQEGYPLVRAEWDAVGQTVTLSQHQFRYEGGGPGTWQVPVVVGIRRLNGIHDTVPVLLGKEPKTIPVPDDMAWILVNQGGWGFYRVAYEPSLWDRILAVMDELTALERFGLVNDVWAGVVAGEVPLTQAVQLWRKLREERDPDVWGTVARNMGLLDNVVTEDERPILQQLVQEIAGPIFEELSWTPAPGEDVRRARLRGTLVRLLGTTGSDASVGAEARSRWRGHIRGGVSVPPELLTPIAEVVAATGTAEDWDLMYQQFKTAATPQDETRYLYSLARFAEPGLIERTLKLYQSPEVRIQDGAVSIGQALANRHASEATWTMIESNWDEILAKYPKMVQYALAPVSSIVEEQLAEQSSSWLNAHPVEGEERHIAQFLEFQRVHRAMAQRIRGRLAALVVNA